MNNDQELHRQTVITAPTSLTAPAQLIRAPVKQPPSGVAVYTALYSIKIIKSIHVLKRPGCLMVQGSFFFLDVFNQ